MLKIRNHKIFGLIFLSLCLCVSAVNIFSQSPVKITKKCPNVSIYSQVGIQAIGDILYIPCPNRSSIFSGKVNFSGATILGLDYIAHNGNHAVGHIPAFQTVPVGNPPLLADTPFTWGGTSYNWNNTGSTCTFCMSFTPNAAGAGFFSAGSTVNSFFLDENTGLAKITSTAGTGIVLNSGNRVTVIGDTSSVGTGTIFSVSDLAQEFKFSGTGAVIHINNDCVGRVALDAGGEFDLAANTTCYNIAAGLGSAIVFATGVTASIGPITIAGTKLHSNAGVGDAGTFVNYWIIAK